MANQEFSGTHSDKPDIFYGYIVVGAAFLIMLAMFGIYYSYGVFFKSVLIEFGWTRAITSGAYSLSLVTQCLLAIVMGRLTDRFGPRLVLTLSGVLAALGYLLMSRVTTEWQLYLAYAVFIGAAIGGTFVPLASTIARWFIDRRSIMTGIVVAGIGLGSLIAPIVANWLISSHDWRFSYLVLGITVLIVVGLAAQTLKRDPAQIGQLPYVRHEAQRAQKAELHQVSLGQAVRTRPYWLVFGMFLSFGFCLFVVLVHIVSYAQELNMSTTSAAIILATIGGFSIIGRIALGAMGDRIGNKQVFILCFILMAATFFWLLIASEAWSLWLFAAVFGFAYGGCVTSQSPLVAVLFGLQSHGLIFGVVNLGFGIGSASGPVVAGYIYDVTSSYQGAFWVCGVISVVGLILSLLLTPARREGQ